MINSVNRQWQVAKAHEGSGFAGMCLDHGHFRSSVVPVPDPEDGQVLIKSVYFSPDPMNHAWVRGVPGRFDSISVGSALRGGLSGRVVASRHPAFKVGDGVTGFLEWGDYNLSDGTDLLGAPLQRVPEGISLASGLGALGMTGLCAYLGMTDIGRPTPGDVVLVSGASGAIGSVAGQIAKLAGCNVIGTARGKAKCDVVLGLGFDAAIDLLQPDWPQQLATLCPDGINVFFDNVGGDLLDTALLHMARRGRIVICGATAHYGGDAKIANHTMLAARGCSMAGFFYFDHIDRWEEGRSRLGAWLQSGALREVFDIAEGFEAVPDAAIGQFTGANTGRKLVRIADDPAL